MSEYTITNETALANSGIEGRDEMHIYDVSVVATKKVTTGSLLHGLVASSGGTHTMTSTAHAGRTIALDTATGVVATLPASTGSGLWYRVLLTTLATSNSHVVKVANTADVLAGGVMNVSTGTGAFTCFPTNATTDTITLNRTTTGSALVGEWLEFVDIAVGTYTVRGMLANTATSATPFSATV